MYDTKAAWEVVVWHYQEMLRLCSGDSLGLRYRFPFLLMQPNRDDDAFCFLRYWMQGDENYVRKRELHKKSSPGDWIYGHEKDARYADIFNVCPNVKWEYVCLALLVALACIKMRTIAESPDRRVELGQQLDRILHLIKERNPTMLPALLNPTPLTSQPKPEYMTQGSPAECYTIVEDASGIWSDVFLEQLSGFKSNVVGNEVLLYSSMLTYFPLLLLCFLLTIISDVVSIVVTCMNEPVADNAAAFKMMSKICVARSF